MNSRTPLRFRALRRRTTHAAVTAAIGALALGALAPSAVAAPRATGPDSFQQRLNAMVSPGHVPGVLAAVRDQAGRTRTYAAGVGDLATGAKVPRDGEVRIGSVTKTFTAVVVLQLAGEGRIRLDDPVETYLPGLLRGQGIDGRHITVRQLLQHTSGLPDYEDDVTDDILQRRYLSPRDTLDIALRHGAVFAPGTRWGYSNTNYLVAGMLVEKVTGRPLAEELDKRIAKKIGLRHTYLPAPAETTLRGPHPHGYHQDGPDGPLRDVTEIDPSAAWSAGAMVSTSSDLTRFFSELMKEGHLLSGPELDQMRTTVPTGVPGYDYGLGIMRTQLPCHKTVWWHDGSIPGYGTWSAATEDGRAASVAMTVDPTSMADLQPAEDAVDAALCG
ncbi:serine hydrolase domain-containing protein [Kitasatospora viridis]|uniref:Alkaline D-peptidase n=1 Tax=Kitasatospora viridis TaxID=281105 RepID=A0A561UI85_9ACTN|nr:serine hydrolase domain-containing protein [Kitasatospora viridis]TWF99083.1 alkaline D-peptidase [Kitasatospora viridis]